MWQYANYCVVTRFEVTIILFKILIITCSFPIKSFGFRYERAFVHRVNQYFVSSASFAATFNYEQNQLCFRSFVLHSHSHQWMYRL